MSRLFVPEHPTTQELREKYPQTPEERAAIAVMRERVSNILGGLSAELLVNIGGCATTLDEAVMMEEAEDVAELTNDPDSNITGLVRRAIFKPRTLPDAWHGLITSHPEPAYRILNDTSRKFANVTEEISTDPRHLERDAQLLTMAWKGGRNAKKPELTRALTLYDPMLPIAVKNGLDGDIEPALAEVELIETLRRGMGARAILLYRGGENAKNRTAWRDQYLHVHRRTGGRFILDLAHGCEQAHDPEGKFGKSVEGQIACMNHAIDLAEETGDVPAGIISEASRIDSPTDPVAPPDVIIEGAKRLAEIKRKQFVLN